MGKPRTVKELDATHLTLHLSQILVKQAEIFQIHSNAETSFKMHYELNLQSTRK